MSSFFSLEGGQSLLQARWVLPPVDERAVVAIMTRHGLPEIVARLLAARGIVPDQVQGFLYPRLSRDFPDPFAMAGMTAMAEDLAQAIADKRKIAVFADFDVDGATSSSILLRFLRHCGLDPLLYVPDRMAEGYGPNENALHILKGQGAGIVVMCDCGITAHGVIEAGRNIGLDIIVFDHHEAEDKLPPANHIINPKRKDDTSGLTMLAACGVTFLSCVAINAKLRENGFFQTAGIAEPALKEWLDIVALGTVCDMVPLTGCNRMFVRFGLEQMAKTGNAGLKALFTVAKIKDAPTPYHLGFALGPRINAGSRVHKADLGARLLSTDNPEEAKEIAWVLNDCNDKRKLLQAEMMDQAIRMVEDAGLAEGPFVFAWAEGWHPGLSGLVAGRLKEKYGKPAIVIAFTPGESGMEGKGSARSVPGVNMGAAFIDARNEGILLKGGGHAMAAGFTLGYDRLDEFRAFLTAHVERQLQGQVVVNDLKADGVLSVRGAQPDFVRLIHERMGPFGQEHEEPLFILPNVRLYKADVVGTDHVRCMVGDWEGGSWMKAVAFRAKDTPLGEAILKQSDGRLFNLIGHFKIDTWSGQEKVEMHITDASFAAAQAVIAA